MAGIVLTKVIIDKHLTPAEKQRMIKLRKEGHSYESVADLCITDPKREEQYIPSASAVARWLKRKGL